jgi:hypothetical protein
MKTIIFSSRKPSLFTLAGLLLLLTASCGSYQNSSYYDTDGIYGNTYNRTVETNVQNNQNEYKEYFGSLRDDNQPPEVFTDIDNYNDYNLDNDQENYPGWGSNPQSVSINVYDTGWAMNNWYGNNWGWNGGFGWGMNNWYGNNWGMNNWGMNNWGWNGNYGWGMNFGFGLNNFGWNNWYGNNWGYANNYNNREYSYNSSRRGSSNSNTADTNRSYNSTSRTFSNDRSSSNSRTFSRDRSDTNRSSNTIDFRRGSDRERTNDTYNRSNTNQNESYNSPSRTRTDTNNSRRGNATPTRSYTPAPSSSRNESYSPNRSSSNNSRNESYSPSRSSSPSSNSGRSSQGSSRRGNR